MTGALKGVRILELTTMITGPLAGVMLADLGAEVIKVENPKGGDYFRAFRGGSYSPHFCAFNRNKRSIALDIQSAIGKEVLAELVANADVLIENFRPGVMQRLGFDYEAAREINPRLIYCSITGFGKDGPYQKRPAYDAVAQAISGISSLYLSEDSHQITGPTIADNMTGIYACYGILGALYERGKTGSGRLVEVNMLDSALSFMPDTFVNYTQLGIKANPLTRVSASQSYAMRCSDGKLLAVHMSSQDKFWKAMQDALGREDLSADPRFTERSARMQHYPELAVEFDKTMAARPREYWMERFRENDVPHAPVNSVEEVFEDPQVRHLDCFAEIEHLRQGKYSAVRRPVWYDGSRAEQPLRPPPELNEHGEEILNEIGYRFDDESIPTPLDDVDNG